MQTFANIEAVKFRDEREIYRCTRKRQGCTRKRQTSGRGSPPSHSFSFCACTHFVQRICITPHRTAAVERVNRHQCWQLTLIVDLFCSVCFLFVCHHHQHHSTKTAALRFQISTRYLLLFIVSRSYYD